MENSPQNIRVYADIFLQCIETDLLLAVVQRDRFLTLTFLAAIVFIPAMVVISGVTIYMVRLRPTTSIKTEVLLTTRQLKLEMRGKA